MAEDVNKTLEDLKAEIQTARAKLEESNKKLEEATKNSIPKTEFDALKKSNEDLKDEVSKKILDLQRTSLTQKDKDQVMKDEIRAMAASIRQKPDSIPKDSLRTQIDEDGGFFVTPEIEKGIMTCGLRDSAIRRLAKVRTTSSKQKKFRTRTSNASSLWVVEGETRSVTEGPKYKETTIEAFDQFSMPEITTDLIEDADEDMVADLIASIMDDFSESEGDAFINGDGIAKPHGILKYPTQLISAKNGYEWGKLSYVKTGAAGALSTDQWDTFIDAISKLKSRYKAKAKWVMSSDTLAAIQKIKDTSGKPLVLDNLQLGQPRNFLGYGIEIDDSMPSIASGEVFALFGSIYDGYGIVDRRGIKMLIDPYTKKGSKLLSTDKRVGGSIYNFEAFLGIAAKA